MYNHKQFLLLWVFLIWGDLFVRRVTLYKRCIRNYTNRWTLNIILHLLILFISLRSCNVPPSQSTFVLRLCIGCCLFFVPRIHRYWQLAVTSILNQASTMHAHPSVHTHTLSLSLTGTHTHTHTHTHTEAWSWVGQKLQTNLHCEICVSNLEITANPIVRSLWEHLYLSLLTHHNWPIIKCSTEPADYRTQSCTSELSGGQSKVLVLMCAARSGVYLISFREAPGKKF